MAPAPQSSRLSASSVRRSAPALAPSAARMASSPSRRTERARIRFATFEHAMTKTSADAASSTSRTVLRGRRDLIAQPHGIDPEVGLGRIRLRIFLDDRAVDGAQLGARGVEVDARGEAAEELGHAVHAPGHHRRRQVVRARHHVRDDFGFRRIRNRRLEDADDRRRAVAQPHGLADHRRIALQRRGPEAMRQHGGAGGLRSVVRCGRAGGRRTG